MTPYTAVTNRPDARHDSHSRRFSDASTCPGPMGTSVPSGPGRDIDMLLVSTIVSSAAGTPCPTASASRNATDPSGSARTQYMSPDTKFTGLKSTAKSNPGTLGSGAEVNSRCTAAAR